MKQHLKLLAFRNTCAAYPLYCVPHTYVASNIAKFIYTALRDVQRSIYCRNNTHTRPQVLSLMIALESILKRVSKHEFMWWFSWTLCVRSIWMIWFRRTQALRKNWQKNVPISRVNFVRTTSALLNMLSHRHWKSNLCDSTFSLWHCEFCSARHYAWPQQ